MRVLHAVDTLNPADGGPAMSVPSLAAAQASHGHSVAVLFRGDQVRLDEASSLRQIPGVERVRFLPLNLSNFRVVVSAAFPRNGVREHLSKFDVLHIHGIWRPLLFIAARAADRVGLSYAVAPRGMLGHWSLEQKRLKKRLALRLGWRSVLDRARFVQALNSEERGEIESLGVASPVITLPNGVFPAHDPPQSSISEFQQRFPAFTGRPYILFLSRLHYMKGLDYLIDAFAEICRSNKNVLLLIAGPDAGQLKPMQQLAKRYAVHERIHFIGPLYGELKRVALARALCFCQPSRQEGFSMAMLEALSFGLPVVTSRAAHFPEIEACGAGRVVDPESAELTEALRRYIDDDAARIAAGKAGKEMVASRFSWSVIARHSIDAYEALLVPQQESGSRASSYTA